MLTLSSLPLAALLLAAPTAAPPTPAVPIAVTVANPLAAARAREAIAIPLADLAKAAAGFEAKHAVVVDAAGKPVLSQLVDLDGDDKPDELVFQTDLGAKASKRFEIRAGTRAPASVKDYKAYGRFVRERHDDFAWENDLVAHRVYGPALETYKGDPLTSSGIDTWVKRVPKLVVNDWYMTGNYHEDHGEGADFYGVGKTRGCGGLGIWSNGKLHVSKNFTHSRVLAQGPIRLVFELTFAPWPTGDGRVGEIRRIVLDAGTRFNRVESTFAGLTSRESVALGIAKHAGGTVSADGKQGIMRTWEPLKDGRSDKTAGRLGCAIVLPPGTTGSEQPLDTDYLLVTSAPANGRLVYYFGSGWDRSGSLRDEAAWAKQVQALSDRLATPVQVTLAAAKAK